VGRTIKILWFAYLCGCNHEREHHCLWSSFIISHGLVTRCRIISIPYSDFCQPLNIPNDKRNLVALGEYFRDISNILGIKQIELRWEYGNQKDYNHRTFFYRHFILLKEDDKEVYQKFHRTQRQNIRSAIKHGVEVEMSNSIEALRVFYCLHCLTRKRLGMPVQPWRFFSALHKEILSKNLGFILSAYKRGICLASGIFLLGTKTLTYKYAASHNRSEQNHANHLIMWTAIQWACRHGFNMLDLGRCDLDNEGLRAFKLRFGATEARLAYSYKGFIPQEAFSSRKQLWFKHIIRSSPTLITRLAGALIYPIGI